MAEIGSATAAGDGLASKLSDIRSSGWVEVEAAQVLDHFGDEGYCTVVVAPRRTVGEPKFALPQLVAMDLYGFMQRAAAAAGQPERINWFREGGSGDENHLQIVNTESGALIVQVFQLNTKGHDGLAHVRIKSSGNGEVGPYSTAALVMSWAKQLPAYASKSL